MRIALLEDDSYQAELVRKWLAVAEHDCRHFSTGRAFLKGVLHETYDLAVLDWGLPDMEGTQVLRELRERAGWSMPVLFVTARDREEDVVFALDEGADDYMAKPVKRSELLARINALGRRIHSAAQAEDGMVLDPYRIDIRTRRITRDGHSVELTEREFDLVVFLFRNVGRLLSRGYILENVWGTNPDLSTRTIDTHVSRCRSKLGLGPEVGWRLRSVYQHGYRLERLEPEAERA